MGRKFSDVYTSEAGGDFVTGDEKEDLIATGATFPVLKVYRSEGGQFGPKYNIVTVLPDDAERERLMSFGAGSVESRDRQLDALINFIEEEGDEYEAVNFRLTRVKQSLILVDADADQ